MKKLIGFLILIILAGCSAYTELEPKPPVDSKEDGYIELKNDDEKFELDKDDKYYIKFPKPASSDFYLVLKTAQKNKITSFLTPNFEEGEDNFVKITDNLPEDESRIVYPMENAVLNFHWVIDRVAEDMLLDMTYRYVPKWRFNFENRFDEYSEILAENKVPRDLYNRMDKNFDLSSVNFARELAYVNSKSKILEDLKFNVIELESIFPLGISKSDNGYQNYNSLKDELSDEIDFQNKFATVLSVFKLEQESQNDVAGFLEGTPNFVEFMRNSSNYPFPIVERATESFRKRLEKVVPYYDAELRAQNNLTPITFEEELESVEDLFSLVNGSVPKDFRDLSNFVTSYNQELNSLELVRTQRKEIDKMFKDTGSWPPNYFYPQVLQKVEAIRDIMPRSRASSIAKYQSFRISQKLGREIDSEARDLFASEAGYRRAEKLVPEINNLRALKDYKQAIVLLKANDDLRFLINQYSNVDELSLTTQTDAIKESLNKRLWSTAETKLRNLHNDSDFLNYSEFALKKNEAVARYENQLFTTIKSASKSVVDSFVAVNQNTITNVEALYVDSAFTPPYRLTFSSKGQTDLENKRSQIQNYIDQMKFDYFPANSIKKLYASFTRNINDRGVEKARAIAVHGKYYNGDDRQVKNIIAECDFNIPKWITKAKEYRKIFVIPATDKRQGLNEYRFKVQLQIPSDAQFPVYDVNIKLPPEVARNSSTAKWFDVMKINNTEIKNEGRIKFTAPSADNDYEFQVSPVQMDKDGRNILDVTFSYPGFKVFEVSVMAQKPIIKKN